MYCGWFIEVTFQEVRRRLGFETQRQWSELGDPKNRSGAVGVVLRGCVTRPPAKGADPTGSKAGGMVRQEVSDHL